MARRVFKGRRRKSDLGRPIRLSDEVLATLKRKNQRKQSWDALLRRMLGMPTRNGDPQALLEGFVEVTESRFYATEAKARGAAVLAAVARGTRRVRKPIHVRECI